MLDGELEYRKGNHDAAFAHLERSIELDDNLPYDEPWGWMQPTRHAYGALLLEQGHVEEAEAVYRADLGLDDTLPRPSQHPDNVWACTATTSAWSASAGRPRRGSSAQQLKFATRWPTYRPRRPASAGSRRSRMPVRLREGRAAVLAHGTITRTDYMRAWGPPAARCLGRLRERPVGRVAHLARAQTRPELQDVLRSYQVGNRQTRTRIQDD